ncbi:glycosyl transferase [Morchella conica CCBAS932]|uniref:Glycosyl transferase n=1 Tax=Morchella conica CCBAS932 TaxID=1392247 RepID=A0A3N4KKD3_9PEZI|nr:glycosyl transferase [Morchella conica CCBAS932]
MTGAQRAKLWRQPEAAAGALYTRLASKRNFARVFITLAFCAIFYNFYSSSELRKSLNDRLQQTMSASPSIQVVEQTEPNMPICSNEPTLESNNGTEKATLVMLVRNREIREALSSMRSVEDRFNRKFHYPWTFLNDKPFTKDFIEYTTGMASGPVEYQVIPKEAWSIPKSINTTIVKQEMAEMTRQNIIYGGSLSYRHMCRFNSGFFYNMEVMKKYDWYWRVEPGIELYCDIEYDPFTFMRTNNKIYGFVITMYEFEATIKTLWSRTKEFEIDGNYNLCHFWSNFEIASLNFYRSEAYTKYFEFLDSAGGFFYERWGDAPVHSLGVGLFAPKDKIHHFADFGYSHPPCSRCPQDDESHKSGRCYCNRAVNFDTNSYSCMPRWWDGMLNSIDNLCGILY